MLSYTGPIRSRCLWCLSVGTKTENSFLAFGAVECVSVLPVPQYKSVEKFPVLIHVGTRAKPAGKSEEMDWRWVKVAEGGSSVIRRSQ